MQALVLICPNCISMECSKAYSLVHAFIDTLVHAFIDTLENEITLNDQSCLAHGSCDAEAVLRVGAGQRVLWSYPSGCQGKRGPLRW